MKTLPSLWLLAIFARCFTLAELSFAQESDQAMLKAEQQANQARIEFEILEFTEELRELTQKEADRISEWIEKGIYELSPPLPPRTEAQEAEIEEMSKKSNSLMGAENLEYFINKMEEALLLSQKESEPFSPPFTEQKFRKYKEATSFAHTKRNIADYTLREYISFGMNLINMTENTQKIHKLYKQRICQAWKEPRYASDRTSSYEDERWQRDCLREVLIFQNPRWSD